MQPLINPIPFFTLSYFIAATGKVGASFKYPYIHKMVFNKFMKFHWEKIPEKDYAHILEAAEKAKDTYDVMTVYTDYIMELDNTL